MSITKHFRGKRIVVAIALLLLATVATLAALPSRFNILNLLGLINRPGHSELTAYAAKILMLSPEGTKALIKGAKAPDDDNWDAAEAHAQTPNDAKGVATRMPDEAIAKFLDYLKALGEKSGKAMAECKTGDSLYYVGNALHAIQDLAFHKGMTNAEHSEKSSFFGFIKKNPDFDKDSYGLAQGWTTDFACALGQVFGGDVTRLSQFNQALLSMPERVALKDGGNENPERTTKKLLQYIKQGRELRELGEKYSKESLEKKFSMARTVSIHWDEVLDIKDIAKAASNAFLHGFTAIQLEGAWKVTWPSGGVTEFEVKKTDEQTYIVDLKSAKNDERVLKDFPTVNIGPSFSSSSGWAAFKEANSHPEEEEKWVSPTSYMFQSRIKVAPPCEGWGAYVQDTIALIEFSMPSRSVVSTMTFFCNARPPHNLKGKLERKREGGDGCLY